jgi:hypothetical protein
MTVGVTHTRKLCLMDHISAKNRNLLGWIGTLCLLLIIPIKLFRFTGGTNMALVIGVVPSILGPPGVLFLLLSRSTGRLSRLTPFRATLIAGVVAVGLEFLQLVPRPGILARVRYTFDYLDLAASVLSLLAAYFVIWRIAQRAKPTEPS